MTELLDGLLSTLAFAGVGLVLLVIGFFMVDLLTPGKLAQQIFVEHRRDAALVLSSSLMSLGVILATAIFTADGDTAATLLDTTAYGLLGVALLGLAFAVLDLITPGRLGELVTDDSDDPAVWVTVALQLAVGLIVAASLT